MRHVINFAMIVILTWILTGLGTGPVVRAVSAVSAATDTPTVENVLKDVRLAHGYQVHRVLVDGAYAYILATVPDGENTNLYLGQAVLGRDGKWMLMGGSSTRITDKPWKLLRWNRANLKYSLSLFSGQLRTEDRRFAFDWCLYGYTTDKSVTHFRIKTKTGYIPLETIDKRYFLRILTEKERQNFVEVQGLNANGTVVQRDNGEWEDKPRQWSPQHSEFY